MENGEHATFIIYAGKRWKLAIRSFKPQVQQDYVPYIHFWTIQPSTGMPLLPRFVKLGRLHKPHKVAGQHN